jgi:hypothetical protein
MTMHVPGRNRPCPCGSGRKFKRCCLVEDQTVNASFVVLGPEAGPAMDPSTPAGREGILRYKRDLYQRWLAEPSVTLGNLTPRQPARQPEHRRALRQELERMEHIESTVIAPGSRMSLDFLWEALGLAREVD